MLIHNGFQNLTLFYLVFRILLGCLSGRHLIKFYVIFWHKNRVPFLEKCLNYVLFQPWTMVQVFLLTVTVIPILTETENLSRSRNLRLFNNVLPKTPVYIIVLVVSKKQLSRGTCIGIKMTYRSATFLWKPFSGNCIIFELLCH